MTVSTTYHGALLSTRYTAVLSMARILETEGFTQTPRQPAAPWSSFTFSSREPLTSDDRPARRGLFRYKVLVRLDDDYVLVCSPDREVLSRLLSYELVGSFQGLLRPLRVDVERLVIEVSSAGGEYVLSAVHVTAPAFGKQLRSISYYGANVTGAELFQSNLSSVAPYAVRLRNVITNRDVIVIRSTGQVTIPRESFGESMPVERAMAFLRHKRYFRGLPSNE